jgi:hypothetical protein
MFMRMLMLMSMVLLLCFFICLGHSLLPLALVTLAPEPVDLSKGVPSL